MVTAHIARLNSRREDYRSTVAATRLSGATPFCQAFGAIGSTGTGQILIFEIEEF
jgi:hypothetical protein